MRSKVKIKLVSQSKAKKILDGWDWACSEILDYMISDQLRELDLFLKGPEWAKTHLATFSLFPKGLDSPGALFLLYRRYGPPNVPKKEIDEYKMSFSYVFQIDEGNLRCYLELYDWKTELSARAYIRDKIRKEQTLALAQKALSEILSPVRIYDYIFDGRKLMHLSRLEEEMVVKI